MTSGAVVARSTLAVADCFQLVSSYHPSHNTPENHPGDRHSSANNQRYPNARENSCSPALSFIA